jgi:NADPH:quinone reductase-like Zn-dependent oxidoreductase
MGLYGHHKSIKQGHSDLVPTSDMCGTIAKVGPSVDSVKEGDRVASIFLQTHLKGQVFEEDMKSGLGLPLDGCLTQYRVFPASGLVKVPEYLSDEEVACLPVAAVTAWMSINSFQPLGEPLKGKEKVVLIQGTGGVAISALQTAKALGLTSTLTIRFIFYDL